MPPGDRPLSAPTWGRLALLLSAALLILTAVFGPVSAASAAPEECAPDTSTGCVRGAIRTAGGEPAAGVAITVEGQGETYETTTDDAGAWSVAVTAAGEYEVSLDEATLPEGETLRDPGSNPRTVVVELGSSAGALFPLGAPTGDTGGTGEDDGSGGETGSGEDADDAGADVGAESAAAQSGSTGTRVLQLAVSGLIFGLLLALASVGLSLLYGTTGLSNFAHGEMVTFGALMGFLFTQTFGAPLVLAGVAAVVIGLLFGYLQDVGLWRPLRSRRVGITQQMIVSIGLAMALQFAFNMFFGGNSLRIVTSNPPVLRFGPIILTAQSAVSVVIAVVVLVAVAVFLSSTRVGRATRAVSDNAALSAASGIDVDRVVRLVWTLSGGLAALGGLLLGLYLNATRWNMGTVLLLLMFAAVTLGGLGTAYGALVGSLVIGLVVELSTLVIPQDMRYASAMVILILVLLVRPQGILGRAERIG
ncbi:branched-chain amino acid ABC transporter permease [Georgenia alba]|uniref:alpha-amylase n=1 Tax=Georgenia alba TaxID=2233858 RepID=A0ABW2QGH6_9MICO